MKVRRTLAYSLFEIAKILGPEITMRDLEPIFIIFLEDLPEVRDGIIESIPELIRSIPESTRD